MIRGMDRAIKRAIEQAHIQTISVDIFDTILLRCVHPESARFERIAEAWHKILKEKDVPCLTLVEMRSEATRAVRALDEDRGGDGETTIDDIVDGVIHLLCTRYQLPLDETKRQSLISAFIEAEIDTEKKMLIPNTTLIQALRHAKERGVRIYFLSDMYLRTEHIHRLLRHFTCDDLFRGGTTSADIGINKGTGRAYERMILKQGFGPIDRQTHLHIGDHITCDVTVPQRLGIRSAHFSRTQSYTSVLRRMKESVRSLHRNQSIATGYRIAMKRSRPHSATEQTAYNIGTHFAPGILTYIAFLNLYARHTKETFVFVSGESSVFSALLQTINREAPHIVLPKVNRNLVLCATLHQVLGSPHGAHDERLSRLIIDRFNDNNFPSFLRSLDVQEEDIAFLLRILRFTQYTKNDADRIIIMDALRTAYATTERMQTHLKGANDELMQMLMAHDILTIKRLCIADIGWLGSMQLLLQIFFEKQGLDIVIQGLYLGTKASESGANLSPDHARGVLFSPMQPALTGLILTECLWEYALETENQSPVQRALHAGLQAGIAFYRSNPTISPPALFRATLPSLIRFMNLPTRREARIIGRELFDLGLGMTEKKTIIDQSESKTLRFRPRRTLRRTKDQLWQAGFLVQHRLYGALLLRFALRLLRAWRSR